MATHDLIDCGEDARCPCGRRPSIGSVHGYPAMSCLHCRAVTVAGSDIWWDLDAKGIERILADEVDMMLRERDDAGRKKVQHDILAARIVAAARGPFDDPRRP